jgi:parallel beta-helix repeat protein
MRFAWCCAAAAALSVGAAVPAYGAAVRCGDTIKRATALRADLTGCAGDGLVVGADGITLDLRGHTISGGAQGAGVRIAGRRGVTLTRGTITGFENAVLLDDADANVIRALAVRGTAARGVQLQNGSDGNRLEDADASRTGRTGFALLDSSANTLVRLSASDNPLNGVAVFGGAANVVERGTFARNKTGIGVDGSDRNRVAGNDVTDSAEAGVIVTGNGNVATGNRVVRAGDGMLAIGDGNVIAANVVLDTIGCGTGECGIGISVESGTGNLVTANAVTRTTRMGIRIDEYEEFGLTPPSATVIRANVVRDAGTDGIAVGTDSARPLGAIAGTRIDANLVTHAAGDGIHVLVADTALARNLALRNGALGIEAVGALDGGGNLARGNGNPRQCLGVAC